MSGQIAVVTAIAQIKRLLANESPEQIGADIGGQVTDYDLRYQPNGNNGRGQHPEFFADDEKQQVDK